MIHNDDLRLTIPLMILKKKLRNWYFTESTDHARLACEQKNYLPGNVITNVYRRTDVTERSRRKKWTVGRRKGSTARATTVGAAWTRSRRRKWRRNAWRRIIPRSSRRRQKKKSASNWGGNRKRFEKRMFLRIARRPRNAGLFSPRRPKFDQWTRNIFFSN